MVVLRQRLADSMVANDLLRTRLEEMADFLEEILSMSQASVMNLSNWSVHKRHALQRSIVQSRELSRSLSQSVMTGIDVDTNDTSCSITAVPDNNNSLAESLRQVQVDNFRPSKVCLFYSTELLVVVRWIGLFIPFIYRHLFDFTGLFDQ